MKKKVIISWVLVVIWMGVIFWFSNMPSKESTDKSEGAITTVIEKSLDTTNGMGITDKHPSSKKVEKVVKKVNPPLRKLMHVSVYFVLGLLVFHAFSVSGLSFLPSIFCTLIFCFGYAITDEWHQTFVSGRSGEVIDVIIDTLGTSVSLLFVFIRKR